MANPDCCDPGTIPGQNLFTLPPCFGNTECWQWDNPALTTPAGLYQGRPVFHPFSPIHCRDDNDGAGIDVRLAGSPAQLDVANLADSACLTTGNPLRRIRLADGSYALTSLPIATNFCESVCAPSCQVILEGTDGDTATGCAQLLRVSAVNDGCWPMKVEPCIDILGAEMFNVGQDDQTAIYRIAATLNGVSREFSVFGTADTTNGAANELRAFAAYSGRICLPSVTLDPGDTLAFEIQPFITWRTGGSPTTTDVTWGDVCVSLRGESEINATTIAALEAS